VVIGTRLVQVLESQARDNAARAGQEFIAGIRAALDNMTQGART
jgi:tryptophan synthase alpha subunit